MFSKLYFCVVYTIVSLCSGFVDDIRYCQVRINKQKRHTQHVQGADEWKETLAFLVNDLHTDIVSAANFAPMRTIRYQPCLLIE